MRSIAALVAMALTAALPRSAAAQPGQTPPTGQPPPPPPGGGWGAPAPGPGWGAPQPQPPTNYHLLTPEERELLIEGEISDGRYIAGGLVGTMFPFGVGQAVQGRFDDTGWIFLVGESASMAAILVGLANCSSHDGCEDGASLAIAGIIGISVFRIWELVDVWVGPSLHNDKVRRVRAKAYGGYAPQWGFHILPTSSDGDLSGATAGVSLRF